MNLFFFITFSLFILITIGTEGKYFSMIKEINGIIYVGGRNSLYSYIDSGEKLDKLAEQVYTWPTNIMNGSDIGFTFNLTRWPRKLTKYPISMAFDTCLNWKQEHLNESMRHSSFDFQHWQYHTPSGDWNTMNFTCLNSFIRGIEEMDNDTLWVCGTFGGFPRAFSVYKENLEFIEFVDVNMMTCSRYADEPLATYKDEITKDLYVASGWGLYRPDRRDPDVPNNNSTMLYADWRLYRNLFTLPSSMAWVLSSDVNFIKVVKETEDHLYFFGYEINNQYGLNNQEDRHAWQSFLLRICKRDLGFKYVPTELGKRFQSLANIKYYTSSIDGHDYQLSPIHPEIGFNKSWFQDTVHLPTKHFVNPLKINFGCYISKRPRSISDNHFWGETNVVYLNKIADVIFDPNRKINFKTKNNNQYFGCTDESHSQLPLMGIFNGPGIHGTALSVTGALCQLQINENIFFEKGSNRNPYYMHNIMQVDNAYEEIMSLSATFSSNFHNRTLHRINGFTLYNYWNQGALTGQKNDYPDFQDLLKYIGTCPDESFYKNMTIEKFQKIQMILNTAWPNELTNKLSSIPSAICQYSSVELYSFNASFVVPGVEFKRIFVIKDNFTNYFMHRLSTESESGRLKRLNTSPLIIAIIITTSGEFYRVTLCDFDNAMANHGPDKTKDEWYNWCIFRHTDQPYLYRQYAPMERREWGESYQYRASSLLQKYKLIEKNDPTIRDPQFHSIKDVLRKENVLHVLTANQVLTVSMEVNCASYKICVECASDPMCMWFLSEHSCVRYEENLFRETKFVQDVLDRGFHCGAIQIKNIERYVDISSLMMFNCSNVGFWRDKIVWKINGKEIQFYKSKQIFFHDDNKVLTLNNFQKKDDDLNISCHGVKEDYDKLFLGKEYHNSLTLSEVLLNKFIIVPIMKPVPPRNSWKSIAIVFMLSTVALFGLLVIPIIWKKVSLKLKKYFNKHVRTPRIKPVINGV